MQKSSFHMDVIHGLPPRQQKVPNNVKFNSFTRNITLTKFIKVQLKHEFISTIKYKVTINDVHKSSARAESYFTIASGAILSFGTFHSFDLRFWQFEINVPNVPWCNLFAF